MLPLGFGKNLVASLLGGDGEDETAAVTEMAPPEHTQPAPINNPYSSRTSKVTPAQGMQQPAYEPQYEQPMHHNNKCTMRTQQPQVHVQQAQFASFDSPSLNQVGVE